MGKQAQSGSSSESSRRGPAGPQRGLYSIGNRALLGQLVNPPNTAIAAPLQQAVSNAQAGLPQMRQNFGLGGGLINQLTGHGVGGGALAAGPNQQGLQSREQLGLPDRSSYFTFVPSAEEVAALGAVPPVMDTPSNRKIDKLQERIDRRQAKGKQTGQAEKKLAKLQSRQPERF